LEDVDSRKLACLIAKIMDDRQAKDIDILNISNYRLFQIIL